MEPFLHLQGEGLDHLQSAMLMELLYGLTPGSSQIQKSAANVRGSLPIPRTTLTQPSSSFLSETYLPELL